MRKRQSSGKKLLAYFKHEQTCCEVFCFQFKNGDFASERIMQNKSSSQIDFDTLSVLK